MTYKELITALSGIFLLAGLSATSFAQSEHEDFDNYKLRIDGTWYYTTPSGYLQGTLTNNNTGNTVDLQKDLGVPTYSTFAGKADWKFTRKNHLYLIGAPFNISHQTTLTRTFTYQGQTFTAGLVSSSSIDTTLLSPGYQYDFIRRKRGHLGLALQLDFFDSKASINAAAQTTADGVHHAAVSASGSLFTPIPVAGPDFRLYITDSPRVFVQGNVFGMYLFGYGNFISSTGSLGVNLTKHLAAIGGYTLATHLTVNNASDRVGLHLTQKGAVAGLEASF